MSNPKTAAERQRAWRARRREEGYQMVTVWLDPDVSDALEQRLDEDGRQAKLQQIINDALRAVL